MGPPSRQTSAAVVKFAFGVLLTLAFFLSPTALVGQFGQLYKVEGFDSLWILGVMHDSDPALFEFDDELLRRLGEVEHVYFEQGALDSFELDTVPPPASGIYHTLSQAQFSQLDAYLRKICSYGAWDFAHLTVFEVAGIITQLESVRRGPHSLPTFLKLLATEQGKQVHTYKRLTLQKMPALLQADMLGRYLDLLSNVPNFRDRLRYFYIHGELANFSRSMEYESHLAMFRSYWQFPAEGLADQILSHGNKGSRLYVVDAAMLGGDQGLLARLADRGHLSEAEPPIYSISNQFYPWPGARKYAYIKDINPVFRDTISYVEMAPAWPGDRVEKKLRAWYPLVSFTGAFDIRFPSRPSETTTASQLDNDRLIQHQYTVEDRATDDFWSVVYTDYPDQFWNRKGDERFQTLAREGVRSMGGTLLREQPLHSKDVRGVEFEIQLTDDFLVRQRIYQFENRLYSVMVGATKSRIGNEENDLFLSSFRLHDQSAGRWYRAGFYPFLIEMPLEPRVTELSKTDGIHQILLRVDDPTGTDMEYAASVIYADDLEEAGSPPAESVINILVQAAVTEAGGVLISEKELSGLTAHARLVEIGIGEDRVCRLLVAAKGHRFLQLSVLGSTDAVYSSTVDYFFEATRVR